MKTYYYTSQTTHYEPYLAHHGVKGMKWGVRHDRERSELRTRYDEAKQQYSSVKKERKAALKSTRKSIKNNLSTKDKLLYQNSLNNRAAHLIVDNNMKYEDAMKKTRKEAWRNTAIFVAAYGGYQLASAYSRKKSRGI